MPVWTTARKVSVLLLGLLALMILPYVFLVTLQTLMPNENVLAGTTSIDVRSGRKRTTTYMLGIRPRREVESTAFSRLYVELHGPPPPPRWVIVRRHIRAFSRTHSHPAAHMLLFHADLLATVFRSGPFGQDAKGQAIRTFLSLAQEQNPREGVCTRSVWSCL